MSSMVRSSIELQNRDVLILRGLFESRVMTLAHVTALYFEGRAEAAKKRLQKLKAAGYVRERPRRPYEPSILFLARQAFVLLTQQGQLADYPPVGITTLEKRAQVSELTLRHELEVMDVKAAFYAMIAKVPKINIAEFTTWPLLYQFKASLPAHNGNGMTEVLVKPDGMIRIHQEDETGLSEHVFFLELDRSTETQEILTTRGTCYGSYYRSGGFAVRCGGSPPRFAEYPFRVLMVFKNAERRNNSARCMLRSSPPIHTQVWMTTMSEITSNPLGAIWVRPVDYREVVLNSDFDVARQTIGGYRRRPGREQFVERVIHKHAILQPTS